MAKITISEGINWKKTLEARYIELVALRNENSREEKHWHGADANKLVEKKPLYDVIELDKTITGLAREIRQLDQAMKTTNASTKIKEYEQNDDILGELKPKAA